MKDENVIHLHAKTDENGSVALYDQDGRRVAGAFNIKLNDDETGDGNGEIWRADLSIELGWPDGLMLTPASMKLIKERNAEILAGRMQ